VSGNVLINEKADRLSSYIVWDYAEGQNSYYRSMLVDLTQPPDKVSDLLLFSGLLMRPEHNETKAKTETRECEMKTETETESKNNETETSIVQSSQFSCT